MSPLPFYTSGMNAQFVLINGMYQPRIDMQVSLQPYLQQGCW